MRRRDSRRLAYTGLYCVILLLAARHVAAAPPPSFQEMEESLTCQCGCGLTVHSCNHLQCPSAVPLRDEIRAQMETGKDKAAILAYFSDKYGEKILSAPSASGFNVLAWVTPFVLVAIGAAVVGFTVMRWSRRRRVRVPTPSPGHSTALSPYEKVFERELERFDS